MARNASGIYSLPLPDVSPDEIISASWANTTLNDIEQAITDSLPRDGSAPMTGPFKLSDGTASLPAFAFNSEASTGLFRPAAGILAITVSGTERARFKGGNLLLGTTTDTGEKLQVAGTVKATTVNADSGTILNLSSDLINTTLIIGVDGSFTNSVSGAKIVAGNGTVSAPSITFGDTSTGLYSTTGALFFSTGGSRRASIGSGGLDVYGSNNFSVGRNKTSDADGIIDIGAATGTVDYDLRIRRASGTNGIAILSQKGTGRFELAHDLGSEFRLSTNATSITHKTVVAGITAGVDYGVFGSNISTAGEIRHFLQNSAQTATNYYLSISRNATGGVSGLIFRTGGDVNTSNSIATALTLSETAIIPNLQVQNIAGTAALPSITFLNDNDTGMYRYAANTIGFATNGVLALRIDTSNVISALPIQAPKSVNASLTLNNYYSATAGFTLNTSLTVGDYFVYNNSAAAITITQGAGLTLRQSGTANTGNRTLAQRGIARIFVLSSTEYIIQGDIT